MIVSTDGLTKRYGTKIALDNVSISLEEGSIYGLVGPNGAGKTTLLGLLSGLRRPTAGTIDLSVDRSRIAVLPDTPKFEAWLTGREVVDLARTLAAPDVPPSRTDEVLAQADLEEAASRRTGGYSRGMLQRLGIAATVVGDPELLLLDEPCAALDPVGRRDVLDLLSQMRGRATVLFSSHILSDVERVCDTVAIMRDGKLIHEGSLDALLHEQLAPTYLIRVRPPVSHIAASLREHPWVHSVQAVGDGALRVRVNDSDAAEHGLAGALAKAHARLIAVEPATPDLEDVFLELTS